MCMGLSCVGTGDGAARVLAERVLAGSGEPSRRRRRRLRGRVAVVLATVTAAVLVLVGGCTAGSPVPEQTFAEYTPTSTPTPTATPTPTPTTAPVAAPIRPADMQRTDEVGAVAAASYFMELFSYVYRSGDLTEWDHISAQDCGFCANVRSDVATVYGAGGHYTGGTIALENAELVGRDNALGVFAVHVPFELGALEQSDRAGVVVEQVDVEIGRARLEVIFTVKGWTLLGGRSDDEVAG